MKGLDRQSATTENQQRFGVVRGFVEYSVSVCVSVCAGRGALIPYICTYITQEDSCLSSLGVRASVICHIPTV